MSQLETLKATCVYCFGTGIRDGFANATGVGRYCSPCDGRGYKSISYVPFTERSLVEGVTSVRIEMEVDSPEYSISYEEFLTGKVPKRIPE